jgi:hypothetical protein
MIKIIAALCSLSSPTNCHEQTVTTSDFANVSMQSCLMGAPQLAEWMKQHPAERPAAWRCVIGKQDGRAGSLGWKVAGMTHARADWLFRQGWIVAQTRLCRRRAARRPRCALSLRLQRLRRIKDGLLRRHEYAVDVLRGAQGAHYLYDYSDCAGFKIVYPRGGDNRRVREPILVSIDIGSVKFRFG